MAKKIQNSIKRDIEFLYEMGTIRYITRTWAQFLNPGFQNLAEHHFRVIWIALMLAKMEQIDSVEKIMKMALVHDVSESRTGDANYIQRQYVKRMEEIGVGDVFYDTALADEFTALWKEVEDAQSLEAQIVKDADNLDVDFELHEQAARGNTFPPEWQTVREHVAKTKLYTKSAKKLWKALQSSSPHDWHVNGKNRFNSGDWKR